MADAHAADYENPEFTLQLLEELVRRHGMTDPLFKRLHHLPKTARISGHRAYCNKHIREQRRFRSPGNPETAARMAICLSALGAGADWERAVERAERDIPFADGRVATVQRPQTGEENVRSELRAFAWGQLKRLEGAGLGTAIEVSSLRDKFVLRPGHPAAARLTTTPLADGFVRADKGSLLFRNATPEFIRSVPRVLEQKRMDSMKGLEFRWTQLSEAAIKALTDLVLRFAAPRRFEPTADPVEFKAAIEELACQPPPLEVPPGQANPERIAVSRTEFRRCPHVVDWVLRVAQGKCERCRAPAPFVRYDGTPFLEVHHVHRLADGGSDKVTNAVALCPNCHRLLHHSPDAEAAVAGLYLSLSRLVREVE